MTVTASSDSRAGPLGREGVAHLVHLLEDDFGRAKEPGEGVAVNQFLLDALDRGEHRAMTVWPADLPVGVCYVGSGGLVVPAGLPHAAQPIAVAVRTSGWRVLVGDLTLGQAIVEGAGTGLFRRRAYAREQRLMTADPGAVAALGPCAGLRRAVMGDLERLTDFACGLHVEDQMGPPLSRSGRAAVQQRVAASIRRDTSWVIEVEGQAAAKFDVSIESRKRGAQLAGVFVDRRWRDRGLARRGIADLSHQLFKAGMPCVTLHVRADNAPAIRAYEAAGFVQRRRWLLALR
jgi:ribosomal protein S18 acetylase RimI-like enzyme